jgi:hypothetical protein
VAPNRLAVWLTSFAVDWQRPLGIVPGSRAIRKLPNCLRIADSTGVRNCGREPAGPCYRREPGGTSCSRNSRPQAGGNEGECDAF